ncbi:hypothetical protein CEXT_708301 [Caerostris extrusa]|uniref:Uncharacterized protein n=1 Tax=Caerostris extrusa TaxID=172846 RepID=A0AAV4Q6U3_CAEEX|nr:hypothetical protein CEXT_708301 [Caerostris extrusa]
MNPISFTKDSSLPILHNGSRRLHDLASCNIRLIPFNGWRRSPGGSVVKPAPRLGQLARTLAWCRQLRVRDLGHGCCQCFRLTEPRLHDAIDIHPKKKSLAIFLPTNCNNTIIPKTILLRHWQTTSILMA